MDLQVGKKYIFKYFIYLLMKNTESERERERERQRHTQAEGEAGSMQEARDGT